ncbi:hypothetical protein [Vibrio vulnificus YJ016]|uniref:Uncharacterized protein n=1 Tax=Vibrio vulnificus (strain YJ016) TaxID=196600 RepID=Q7MJ06_VIBVY|nr:hypothetical protein [Vibrio vulnificus YJ016]
MILFLQVGRYSTWLRSICLYQALKVSRLETIRQFLCSTYNVI